VQIHPKVWHGGQFRYASASVILEVRAKAFSRYLSVLSDPIELKKMQNSLTQRQRIAIKEYGRTEDTAAYGLSLLSDRHQRLPGYQ